VANVRLEAVDSQHDAALLGQEGVQSLAVGRGQSAQLVVAVQEIADPAQGDGDAPARQFWVDLGDAAMLSVAESADQGQNVEAELMVRQGQEGLGFRVERAMLARAVGVGTAADEQREAFDGVEGGDGAAVGVRCPKEVAAFRAVSGNGSKRLGLSGGRPAARAWHDSGLLVGLPPLFYRRLQASLPT
jgi:hypothetical protein